MPKGEKPVKVSPLILKGLEVVRRSRETSMFELPRVASVAERFGYVETACWVREHKRDYVDGMIWGFESTEPRVHKR